MIEKFNLDINKIVVEVNQEIIYKENYNNHILNNKDKIEIISFVGGG